jgi:catechol 2,3-dioxygenase-like lactoylglutathione lyase family enzyme
MRGAFLFVAGIVVGLAVEAGMAGVAENNLSPNKGIVGLNHVCIVVPNLDEAVNYYTKTLGFPEAFRSKDAKGNVTLVYVQISKNTFIEIQPANPQKPAGINHFGLVVDNMQAATAMFKERGAKLEDIRTSPTKAILSNIDAPNGIRIELAQLTPESEHRKAMDRWK